ncbi:MAG: hypothetical protein IIT98_05230 [Kiritimatiellae bacterium]|nr:hypothetical protein [Kiritimatiellia bacterium]
MNDTEEGFTGFKCPACHTEIEASLDLAGQDSECPACGARIKIPADDAIRHGQDELSAESAAAAKSTTIRIELPDL